MTKPDCIEFQQAIVVAERALTAQWPTENDEEIYLDALSGLVAGIKFARWASLYEPGDMQPSKQQRTYAKGLVTRLQRRYGMYKLICTEFASDLTTEQANEAALDEILSKAEYRHARRGCSARVGADVPVTQAEVIGAIHAAGTHEARH